MKSKIIKKLKKVMDPELGVSVYDLGLIYEVGVGEGQVEIQMTLTNPHCPFMQNLKEQVRQSVIDVVGEEKTVVIKLVFDPPWQPDKMSQEAKDKLGW